MNPNSVTNCSASSTKGAFLILLGFLSRIHHLTTEISFPKTIGRLLDTSRTTALMKFSFDTFGNEVLLVVFKLNFVEFLVWRVPCAGIFSESCPPSGNARHPFRSECFVISAIPWPIVTCISSSNVTVGNASYTNVVFRWHSRPTIFSYHETRDGCFNSPFILKRILLSFEGERMFRTHSQGKTFERTSVRPPSGLKSSPVEVRSATFVLGQVSDGRSHLNRLILGQHQTSERCWSVTLRGSLTAV